MGKAISGLFGGQASATQVDRGAYDLTKQADKYSGMSDEQYKQATARQSAANTANNSLIQQLQAQSNGSAPSIAQAQLQSTTNRNLAQQMAAAAAQRSPNAALQQRQLAQQRAAANRDVAEQGAVLRLQEQQANQQQLGSVLGTEQGRADQLASGSVQQGFGIQNQAKQLQAQGESQQAQLNQQAEMANQQAGNSMLGGVLGAAGQLGAAYMTGGASLAATAAMKKAHGGLIDGPEIVSGDNEKNDVVPVMASAGEVVVPKTVVEAGDKAVSAFVKAIMAQKNKKEEAGTENGKKKPAGYAAVVAARKKGK